MLAEIKPFLDWLQLHPHYGGLIAGVIAFIESLVVLGLLVPGTVMMTAIGTLIGAGILPFTSTTLWAISGAILGDVLSFWLGHHYHQHLKDFWPFRTHPKILEKGEQFFLNHGRKGIFIGRFVGPVRPILPVIAGMMSMAPARFLVTDIFSGILWAPVYMLPGILLGAASQELPPETATKLILSVVAALLVFWGLSWLFKKVYVWLVGLLDRQVAWLWKFTATHPRLQILKQILLDPLDPHNHSQLALFLSLIIAVVAFGFLICNVVQHGWLTSFNESVYYFMRSLRTTDADKIFIAITLINTPVYLTFWIATFSWLTYKRYWQAVWHWLAIGTLAFGGTELIKHIIHNPRPLGLLHTPTGWSFPSGHSVLSTALFGFFAVLLVKDLSKNWRWVVYSITAILISSIMLSRLYLGAHWLTDVIGGSLLGFIFIALVTLSLRRRTNRSLAITGLLLVALLSIGTAWTWNIYHHYSHSLNDYTPYWSNQVISSKSWWSQTSNQVPPYRINRFGKPIQLFNVQWAGDLFAIEHHLKKQGWRDLPKASLVLVLNEIAGQDNTRQLPLWNQFYEDRKPVLVMTKYAKNIKVLLVLRLWDAHLILNNGRSLWLGTITYHKAWHANFLKHHPTFNLPAPSNILANDLSGFVYKKITYSTEPTTTQPVLFITSK